VYWKFFTSPDTRDTRYPLFTGNQVLKYEHGSEPEFSRFSEAAPFNVGNSRGK
jgi:hypothetical protein